MRMFPLFRRCVCTIWLLFFFVSFKLITDAPDGFKRPFIGDTLKLFTEPFDVDIYSTLIAVVFKAPYFIKELVTGINSVGV